MKINSFKKQQESLWRYLERYKIKTQFDENEQKDVLKALELKKASDTFYCLQYVVMEFDKAGDMKKFDIKTELYYGDILNVRTNLVLRLKTLYQESIQSSNLYFETTIPQQLRSCKLLISSLSAVAIYGDINNDESGWEFEILNIYGKCSPAEQLINLDKEAKLFHDHPLLTELSDPFDIVTSKDEWEIPVYPYVILKESPLYRAFGINSVIMPDEPNQSSITNLN